MPCSPPSNLNLALCRSERARVKGFLVLAGRRSVGCYAAAIYPSPTDVLSHFHYGAAETLVSLVTQCVKIYLYRESLCSKGEHLQMARENARKNSPDFCLPDSERTEREEGCLNLSHKLASAYLAKRRILQMQERGA